MIDYLSGRASHIVDCLKLIITTFLMLITMFALTKAQTTIPETTRSAVSYLNPPELASSPRYSQAAVINRGQLLLVSGQVALDGKGQLVGRGNFRAQAEQVFANLRSVLRSAGGEIPDIINISTHLVRLADLPTYREVRQAFFFSRKTPPPTSTTVQVAGLATDGALLEVSVMAVIPERQDLSKPANPITVVALLHARAGRADALEKELQANAEEARREVGCLQYDLNRGIDDRELFVLYETWSDREALNAHFETPHMKAWAARRDEFIDRRELNVLQRMR